MSAREDDRRRVAAALEAAPNPGASFWMCVDALMPIIDRIADERAAEALETALRENRTTVSKLSPVEQLTCFIVKGEDLVTRAAALKAGSP